jgi:hypothetical protein
MGIAKPLSTCVALKVKFGTNLKYLNNFECCFSMPVLEWRDGVHIRGLFTIFYRQA